MASTTDGANGTAPTATAEAASNEVMTDPAEFDLLPKLIPHLDRQLIFPILEFLESQPDANPREIQQLKFTLLKDTNMADYVADLEQSLKGLSEPTPESVRRREEVVQRQELLANETARVRELMDQEEVTSQLRSDKVANMNFLRETHGVKPEEVAMLYDYGQFLYNVGDYEQSLGVLFQFRVLSTDNDRIASASWGMLACEILSANWDGAMDEIQKLRETIDTRLFNAPLQQLRHRTWLLHWSLFPFFHSVQARDQLIELWFTPSFINTIQTACPWILRYLIAGVIGGRGAGANNSGDGAQPQKKAAGSGMAAAAYQKQVKDLVRVVRQEAYSYTDPLTSFFTALFVDFDFPRAQQHLGASVSVLSRDFFTCTLAEPFRNAGRHLISESYCRIHARIDVKDLAARLDLSPSEGEKWIVDLIRETRVDAKIDEQRGTVAMNHPPMSVYQQVIERTKGGFFRTQVLNAAVAGGRS